jgi:hypothetical protein
MVMASGTGGTGYFLFLAQREKNAKERKGNRTPLHTRRRVVLPVPPVPVSINTNLSMV